jgi:site-specific recombinase XerD
LLRQALRPDPGVRVTKSLDNHEVRAIFEGMEADTVHGTRDLALLNLMYNTGVRVQELVNLDVDDVRMDAPHHAKLTGKGRKERLGHADVKTTCLYVEINIEMKRKALEALPLNGTGYTPLLST